MRVHDPRQYLAVRGVNPHMVIQCPVCPAQFIAEDGVAFPAQSNGEPFIAYFCCEACYVRALPREAMWNA